MEHKNINRGFKKLRVWQDAVSLYVIACSILKDFPYELKRVASNSIDASHSISRNISEGYCRRSLKEYLVRFTHKWNDGMVEYWVQEKRGR